MKKKTKSIAFSISIFFILLNVLSFALFFYLIKTQYTKMAKRNVHESNTIAAGTMQKNFDDIRSYMNDLTLKIYSDNKLNGLCSQIYLGKYEDDIQRESLAFQAESLCYDYLSYYQFMQGLGIFIEDKMQTNIFLSKTYGPDIFLSLPVFREQIQKQIIENKGVIECFDMGQEHHIIFARTLKDFSNVLKDDKIIGTVMVVIRPQYIIDALRSTITTPNSYALLVNEDGIISYSSKEHLQGMEVTELKRGGDWKDNRQSQITSLKIQSLNQELVIITPIEDISLYSGAFMKTLIQFVVVLIILNLALVLVISRMLANPINNFVSQIQDIGVTSIAKRVEIGGYNEIENIGVNFNKMLERIENLVNENYLISLNEKNARIEALQSQINPHFIFNTLDTINWKVMFMDVPEVTNMITCLGDMLRYTTYQYGKYVSVEQELAQILNYLYIQEIRFNHSFLAKIKVEDEAKKQIIPCLLIQPLVENAVVHGLKNREKNGVIVIRVRMRKEMLEIVVFDNGMGMSQETIKDVFKNADDSVKTSIGLSNVNQRICLTYSMSQGLKIHSRLGYYTRIEMQIPMMKEKQDDKGDCS